MANNNLPKTANAFNAWFSYFHKAFNANAKKYGFSAADIKAVNQYYNNWQTSYNAWNSFTAFTMAMNKFQTSEFNMFQSFLSGCMTQISKNKNFDGNFQAWFGPSAPKMVVRTAKKTATKKATTSTSKSSARTSPRTSTTVKPIAKKVTAKKTTAKKTTAKKTTIKAVKPVAKKVATKIVKPTANKIVKSTIKRTVKPIAKKTTVKKAVAKKITAKPISRTTVSKRTSTRATATKNTATKAKINKRTVKKTIASTTNNSPFVWFTSAKNGVNVYVGSSKNGNFSLPTGTKGAYIECKNGNNSWKKLTQGASFPFVHNTNTNGKISYRACWINSNGKKGSFSRPISYNVTALKAAA